MKAIPAGVLQRSGAGEVDGWGADPSTQKKLAGFYAFAHTITPFHSGGSQGCLEIFI